MTSHALVELSTNDVLRMRIASKPFERWDLRPDNTIEIAATIEGFRPQPIEAFMSIGFDALGRAASMHVLSRDHGLLFARDLQTADGARMNARSVEKPGRIVVRWHDGANDVLQAIGANVTSWQYASLGLPRVGTVDENAGAYEAEYAFNTRTCPRPAGEFDEEPLADNR